MFMEIFKIPPDRATILSSNHTSIVLFFYIECLFCCILNIHISELSPRKKNSNLLKKNPRRNEMMPLINYFASIIILVIHICFVYIT